MIARRPLVDPAQTCGAAHDDRAPAGQRARAGYTWPRLRTARPTPTTSTECGGGVRGEATPVSTERTEPARPGTCPTAQAISHGDEQEPGGCERGCHADAVGQHEHDAEPRAPEGDRRQQDDQGRRAGHQPTGDAHADQTVGATPSAGRGLGSRRRSTTARGGDGAVPAMSIATGSSTGSSSVERRRADTDEHGGAGERLAVVLTPSTGSGPLERSSSAGLPWTCWSPSWPWSCPDRGRARHRRRARHACGCARRGCGCGRHGCGCGRECSGRSGGCVRGRTGHCPGGAPRNAAARHRGRRRAGRW